jgi:hypothetical protein
MEEIAMTCQVQGDSREAVAFGLMQCVLFAAGRANNDHPFPTGSTLLRGQGACTEGEILALYARCLKVVQGAEPTGEHLASRVDMAAQLHS